MNDPSAILAINSLDRYITQTISIPYSYQCEWFYGSNEILYDNNVIAPPVVGGIVTSNGPGWPVGVVRVVSIIPTGGYSRFTIDALTTADNLNGAGVLQVITISNANQPTSNALQSQYDDVEPYSNNFTIQSPGALIYGYINRIIVSQIQLQYNIPTVNSGLNDTFVIAIESHVIPFSRAYYNITIPHGFYYADELAATLQTLLAVPAPDGPQDAKISVVFSPRDGFVFTSQSNPPYNIWFPSTDYLNPLYTSLIVQNVLKTYRLLGMTVLNSEKGPGTTMVTTQTSFDYPNFLYTPYIDFYSDILTNYQNIKDTNTSIQKPKGLVARVYVSGTGQIQVTGSTSALGTAPFVMTSDLNSPKVIRWSSDVAVPSIDFQLLDQYGDLIPGAKYGYSTEFQMTLLCIEGRD